MTLKGADMSKTSDIKRPLIVDMDGTLLRNDSTFDLLALSFFHFPLKTILIIFQFFANKPALKEKLFLLSGHKLPVEDLPYNEIVVEFAKDQSRQGRTVILCSGGYESLVQCVSKFQGYFTEAFGTADGLNLTSKHKAAFLKNRYPNGFDYIGNSNDDIAVWAASEERYAISPPNKARKTVIELTILDDTRHPIRAGLKAMRLHQWAKNLLLFLVPALIIDRITVDSLVTLGLAFVALGLLASGTYILNDMADIANDRAHPTKHKRPFASGKLNVGTGLIMSAALIIIAGMIALYVNAMFFTVLLGYFILTLCYSFYLKRVAILDVITLANLFLIRVAAGAAVVNEPLSAWLVCFVLSFFLSLSLVKRYAEVEKKVAAGGTAIVGRGYRINDGPLLLSFGVMSVAMTLLCFMLYSLVAENPAIVSWFPLLAVGIILTYWIMRIWLLAYHGDMNEDPVLFAIKDPISLACGLIIVIVVFTEKLVISL